MQVDLQRLFRQRIRCLREQASAENPCNYGYPERLIDSILTFVGESRAGGVVMFVGAPVWHEEQLHLAEWQALQELEFLFNLSMNVDAKNLALEKMKEHKRSAHAKAEVIGADAPSFVRESEEDDVAGDCDLLPPAEEVVPGLLLPPVTDESTLMNLLQRNTEVALARLPGQGRREGAQSMKEIADVFGVPEHRGSHGREISIFGAAEHEKDAAVARHRATLETLRAQQVVGVKEGETGDASSDGATEHAERLPRAEEISDEDDEEACKLGPIAYAKLLCEQAGLTSEQRGPVALIAHDMDKVYQEEMKRRENLTEAQLESLGYTRPGTSLMPLSGRVARILIFGGVCSSID